MDLFSPLKTSTLGKNYILCVTIEAAKYAEQGSIAGKSIPSALFLRWLCRHIFLLEFVLDNGKESGNKAFDNSQIPEAIGKYQHP
jgi:hypothetical protein